MRRILLPGACLFMLLLAWAFLTSGAAQARTNSPASTHTLQIGPYVVDVNLSQDPPNTDQPSELTVVPHNTSLRLSGKVTVQGGLGNENTVPLHWNLSPVANSPSTLHATISMPVRGAWDVLIHLDGPQGSGDATPAFTITVAGPGAIPVWLAWVIATAPLLGIAWLVWQQTGYRRKLAAQKQAVEA